MQREALLVVLALSFSVFGAWACPDGPRVIGPDGSIIPAGEVGEPVLEAAGSAVPAGAPTCGILPVLVVLLALGPVLLFRPGRAPRPKVVPVLAVLLVALGLEAAAAGFEVAAPPPQEATSGDTLRYIFSLTNTGDLEESFILGASSQHGWSTAVSGGSTLSLGPGETAEIAVDLFIPRAVEAGTEDVLTLVVVSRRTGEVAIASVTTVVTRNYMRRPHHVYGVTPVDTAGVYASAAYPAYSANDKAVLVTVEDYGDAMLGSVLACFLNAPLLATSSREEDLRKVRALLVGEEGLGIRKVYVVGRLAALRADWSELLGVPEVEVLRPSSPFDLPTYSRELALRLLREPGEIPEEVIAFLTEHNVEKLWLAGDETDFPEDVIEEYYRIQCSYFERLKALYPKGDWPLKVTGDVGVMLDLTVPELKAEYADRIVTVSIRHPKKGLREYTGIRLLDLLEVAGARIPCKVAVVAADGYQKTFLYEDIEANPDILLAIESVKGQERLDLKVPGYPGWWWVKDVVKVIVIGG